MAVLPGLVETIPYGDISFAEVTTRGDASYGSAAGPFAVIAVHGSGERIYLNESTVNELATTFGWTEPNKVEALYAQRDELATRVDELEQLLQEERLNKTVPLAEVIDFVAEREKRRPEPVAS